MPQPFHISASYISGNFPDFYLSLSVCVDLSHLYKTSPKNAIRFHWKDEHSVSNQLTNMSNILRTNVGAIILHVQYTLNSIAFIIIIVHDERIEIIHMNQTDNIGFDVTVLAYSSDSSILCLL